MILQLNDMVAYAEKRYEVTITNSVNGVIIAVKRKKHGKTFGADERLTARMMETYENSANEIIERLIEQIECKIEIYTNTFSGGTK